MLVLLITLEHFIFAFLLTVAQLFYDFDVLICEFVKRYVSIIVLVKVTDDFLGQLGRLLLSEAILGDKIAHELLWLQISIVVGV